MTGDEPQWTLLSPSCLSLRPHFHRERDIWVRDRGERIINFLPLKREGLLDRGAYLKGGGGGGGLKEDLWHIKEIE